AKAEHNDKGRGPLHHDNTVCSTCYTFLRYVETMDGLTLETVSREEFEGYPEQVQASLLQVRGQYVAAASGSTQGPLGYVLAKEIAQLKDRVAVLERGQCGCNYCRSGDGLNCIHRRR
ncbi:MAG: hypothetical protein ACYTF5_21110, partial [Planctomycetota bacterium]